MDTTENTMKEKASVKGSGHWGAETLVTPSDTQSFEYHENLHQNTDDAKEAINDDRLKLTKEWVDKTLENFDVMSVRSDHSMGEGPTFRSKRQVDKETQTNEDSWISMVRFDTWVAVVVGITALLIMLYLAFKGQEIDHHELRLMLVGKTGAGKSASANTILGEEAFRVEASPASVTPDCENKTKVVDGRNVTIIDTPGVMDTWLMSDEEAQNAPDCISMIVPGPHVFLLVIRIGRFTKEEVNAVKWIQENFGEVAVKFTMILFTGGDLLERKPIQKFISNSVELQNLVETCDGRYHVFNNYDRSDRTQVTELFQKIKLMLHENMGYMYTNEIYSEVQLAVREEEELKKKELMKQIKEEKMKLENREEEFRKEEELKWSQAIEVIKAEEQKKLNRMASELRDEQYENMKLKAELQEAQSYKFWAGFIILVFIFCFIFVAVLNK